MSDMLYLSPPCMTGEEQKCVEAAFKSNWIAPLGPMLTEFENGLAELTGIPHVAGLSSGTAALHLALRLSEVVVGDEVWCPTLTFIGGIGPILYERATPVFLDSDAGLLLDLDMLENELCAAARRGKLPKAVITTDLYGLMPDMARLEQLQAEYGFSWISDSAEAVGSSRSGRHAGKGARLAIYSFNGNKIITTSGGGALASDDPDLVRRAVYLSTQARDAAAHYQHSEVGYNYRLSNICAAIGVGQLRSLTRFVEARRRIFDSYRTRLGQLPGIRFVDEPPAARCNRWLTTIFVDPDRAGLTREDIRIELDSKRIESRPLWKPMHMQPVFAGAKCVGGAQAERHFERGLCLPSGSAMTDADLDRIMTSIENLVKERV